MNNYTSRIRSYIWNRSPQFLHFFYPHLYLKIIKSPAVSIHRNGYITILIIHPIFPGISYDHQLASDICISYLSFIFNISPIFSKITYPFIQPAYSKKLIPRNIIAFAIFPLAGALVGANMRNIGNVLKTAAHLGRSVFPVITNTKNTIANTSKPT